MSDLLFCGTELAARIESAEAKLIAAGTDAALRRNPDLAFVTPVAGGFACFGEDGAPLNKVVGLGFGGVPSEDLHGGDRRGIRGPWSAHPGGADQPGGPEIGAMLTGNGYRLVAFENVLGKSLDANAAPRDFDGVEIRLSGEDELDDWLEVVTTGFVHPDEQGVATHEDFPREIIERAERDFVAAGARTYLALRDGVVAGGGGLRITDGVAQLVGAATAPEHRRRGVQTALLSTRLADAAAAGCDIAVVTTAPGSKSQQNVQRQGFQLLYTRAVLVK